VEEVSGWTRDSWAGSPATSDYSGHATSHGNDCTLRQLAQDITGNAGDYWLLRKANPGITINPKTTAVPNGTTLDISPLLAKLETTLRSNVAAAAVAKKFAHFPVGTESWSNGTGLDEAAVNKVFTGGNASIDCFGMAEIVMARGLIKTLKPGEFDALFTDTDGMPTVQTTETLDNTKLGDWLYFANDPNYLTQHPDGPNQGENVIECIHSPVSSANSYMGWTRTTTKHNYDWWCNELVDAYNDEPPPPTVKITSVPGYDGSAKFLDVAAIAQAIFDHRTATP
jgi:hypothetical protein